MTPKQNQEALFELLRAGLWEKEARLSICGTVNLREIYRIAEAQSVIGLVSAGLERVKDVELPKENVLQFVGQTLQIEQRNRAMNHFLASMENRLQEAGIYAMVVKGQGIAQCYERPLWRNCGDIDYLFDKDNYEKAKCYLSPIATKVEEEDQHRLHLGMIIDSWVIELHGTLRGSWSNQVDALIDTVQEEAFKERHSRIWNNEGVDISLPSPNDDVIFLFTHILQHYFIEGVGFRQICDWCRLLYKFHDSINHTLLRERLEGGGLMYKWKTFASLAVNYLGMPKDMMPFYSNRPLYMRNAKRLLSLIMDTGNFGQGRDHSYKLRCSFIKRMIISFGRHTKDGIKRFSVFPVDALRVWSIRMAEAGGFIFNRKSIM